MLEGHIDEAFHWIQTGFAMARHASQGPLLVQSLVSVNLSQSMCVPLEDLVQAPGTPSLFWAISQRPRPLTDFSAGFESERFLLEREIPSLSQVDGPPWSVEKGRLFAAELQEKLFKLAEISDGSGEFRVAKWSNRMGMAGLIVQVYPEAKRALIAQGRPSEQVESMPAVQVAVLCTRFSSTSSFAMISSSGRACRLSGLQANGRRALRAFAQGRSRAFFSSSSQCSFPRCGRAGVALALSERRLDAIQCIEAIRLHAAINGKLPARLEEITEAPVPTRQRNGQAVRISRPRGSRRRLRAPYPPGGVDIPQHKINYELKRADSCINTELLRRISCQHQLSDCCSSHLVRLNRRQHQIRVSKPLRPL